MLTSNQLKDARATLEETVSTSDNHARVLQERAHKFRKKQADIDRRLLIITQSQTSDDAVQKFEENLKRLQRLDIAKGYVELLNEVERLRYAVMALRQIRLTDSTHIVPSLAPT